MMKFNDNTKAPIIALDFDGVIAVNSEGDDYPEPKEYRLFVPEVTNFMHKLGITVVVWTCRENKDGYDHISPIIKFMQSKDIHYDSINDVSPYASYVYNSRKLYAHMYVDDKNYGWRGASNGNDPMMLLILEEFLHKVCGFSHTSAGYAVACCKYGGQPEQWMIDGVKSFKTRRCPVRLEEELEYGYNNIH